MTGKAADFTLAAFASTLTNRTTSGFAALSKGCSFSMRNRSRPSQSMTSVSNGSLLRSAARNFASDPGSLNDEGSGRTNVHDVELAELLREDAGPKGLVSADVHAAEERDKQLSNILRDTRELFAQLLKSPPHTPSVSRLSRHGSPMG